MSSESPISPATRERELVLGALNKAPSEQAAFLDGACGGDAALRQRVEDALRERQKAANLPGTLVIGGAGHAAAAPTVGPGGTAMIVNITEKPGDRIGRYRLLQRIGEGGCGIVYLAEQEEPVRRRVALKIIKLGMDTESVIARFEAERQALAMMDHPNIAKVLDAGATDTGRPYFVMELVRGIRFTDYCDQHQLSTEERLRLFIQACLAIQHAHQKGIIHRDIKPSNILVTLQDGAPVPKVIDFGIAKATESRLTGKALVTEFTAFIGTPAYMSPEQAEMSGMDIDTRSDIYSLGVLLYELLTGRTPFDSEVLLKGGLDECRRTIREEEPARPSTRLATLLGPELTTTARQRRTEAPKLIHLLSGDLDWIAMKCLEKDRTRRYATANDLGADIQRYLEGELVLARPPSNLYRLQKLVRRHRGALAAAAAITAALVGGAAISVWQALRATQAEKNAVAAQRQEAGLRQRADTERERAETEKASARLNEYVADINLAQQSLKAGNHGRAFQLLEKHRPQTGAPDLRGFEWRYLWQLCQGDEHRALPAQSGPVESVAFSPSGEMLAIGTRDKVSVWDVRQRSLVATEPQGAASLAFLPDGKGLVIAGRNARVLRTADWAEQSAWQTAPGSGFGPGGGPGSGSGPAPDPGPGRGPRPGPDSDPPPAPGSGAGPGSGRSSGRGAGPGPGFGLGITLSLDGSLLAAPSREGVSVRSTSTWKELRLLREAFPPVAFSRDGKKVATDAEVGITLWALEGETNGLVLEDSTNVFVRGFGPGMMANRAIAFSPDGKSLVAARNTLSAKGVFVLSIWDATSGKELAVVPQDPEHIEHTGIITGLAFSPDGLTLATASMDYSIRLWDFAKRQPVAALQGHLNEVMAVAFAPDGRSLVSGARGGSVKLWPTRSKHKEDFLGGFSRPLAFSQDGRTLASLTQTNSVLLFNLETGEPEQQFPLDAPGPRMEGPPRPRGPSAVAMSADLRTLAQGHEDGSVTLWNTGTLTKRILKTAHRPVELVSLSADGQMLITGGRGQRLHAWNLRSDTNALLAIEATHVLFSPDGRTVAAFQRSFPPGPARDFPSGTQTTAPATNVVLLWDLPAAALRTEMVMDSQPGMGAAFSPDSRILATASFDVIRLWDVATGRSVGTCAGHKQSVGSVAFAPDGKTLASASDDSTLKLWNVATQQELLTIRRLGGTVRDLLFSPDGRWLVGGTGLPLQSAGLRLYRSPLLSETDSAATRGRTPEPP